MSCSHRSYDPVSRDGQSRNRSEEWSRDLKQGGVLVSQWVTTFEWGVRQGDREFQTERKAGAKALGLGAVERRDWHIQVVDQGRGTQGKLERKVKAE